MTFYLIRHGKTQGNLEGRYIGCRTDEPLCAQGAAELAGRRLPPVRRVFSSPMLRCVQTAKILFPGMTPEIAGDLRECDFGAFENLCYAELNGRADYQRFIDSGGEMPFPGGESRTVFAGRCVRAFERCTAGLPEGDYAFIVHGGTIMSIMERIARPAGTYYDFQVRNGEGYAVQADGTYQRL